jgi:cell division inhibitor SulA/protein ImuA
MSESISSPVETLLRHPQLWRAGRLEADDPVLPTGYAGLDALLAGGGWPANGVIELLCDRVGIGELRLLGPALTALTHAEPRWVLWLAPPHIPYAPALTALDIDIRRMLLVHPRQPRDALWALEQALRSGTCGAALAWLDERTLKTAELRRLKLAAREGGTLCVLFRPESAARHTSMAELRLRLAPAGDAALGVEILKRRGGWPARIDLRLPPASRLTHADLADHLTLWRHRHTAEQHRPIGRRWPLPSMPRPAAVPLGQRTAP